MIQLKKLRNFNSKCDDESLLVVNYTTTCGVPDGLVKFGCLVIAHTHIQCKQMAVKSVLSSFEIIIKISNVCYTKSAKSIASKL